jgi:hypothetical protein
MYEIGKVYIWIGCYSDSSIIGKETIVTGPVKQAFIYGTDTQVFIQATDSIVPGKSCFIYAQKGMLIPKDSPSGERKVMEQFQPKLELEPA